MRMLPYDISVMRIKAFIIVDFPDPVLPTIPTFSPALMTRLKSLTMLGRSSRYLSEVCLNYIIPLFIVGLKAYSTSDQL